MPRTSDPVLKWLRGLVDGRGLNTAALAQKCGVERARLRRILTGSEPMLVDELLLISNALEISPADMGLPEGTREPDTLPLPPESPATPAADPWGNHVEQLFRVAFALGCDFQFAAETAQLAGSGVPKGVLDRHPDVMPIFMKAEYHPYNEPKYDVDALSLVLSFDALYTCRFPWSSIRQIAFFPASSPPKPVEDTKPKRPHLRLVDTEEGE